MYTLALSALCSCRTPNSGSECVSESFVFSRDSFPPVG